MRLLYTSALHIFIAVMRYSRLATLCDDVAVGGLPFAPRTITLSPNIALSLAVNVIMRAIHRSSPRFS